MNELDYVLSRIEPWINKYITEGVHALTPLERIGVGVWMLEAEVNNGGFDQYYFNSAGELALETVEALKTIGAIETSSLLSAANAEFPGAAPPQDRNKRQTELEAIRDTARFAGLEHEFYRDAEQLVSRLANFLRTQDDARTARPD